MNCKMLKDNYCPDCESELDPVDENDLVHCSNEGCDFIIRFSRLEELLEEMDDSEIEWLRQIAS